jgi:PAS domain S-box-containing protein
MDTTTDSIFIKDTDGKYLLANAATGRTVGKPLAEIIGKTDADLFPPESAERIHVVDNQVITLKKPLMEEEKLETTAGETYWLANKSPYLDEHGNIIGIIGISRDITVIKDAEKEKEKLQAQLRQSQKMESIGTLAGGIAHDFNNMLGIILGNAELALYDVPERNPARHNLNEVIKASHRAKEVVRQLLSFSRKSEISKKPVRIGHLIRESLKLMRASLPATIDIQQEIPDDLAAISADATQIHQIVINLCANASQAMDEEGGTLDIRMKNVYIDKTDLAQYRDIRPGGYVSLSIRDSGHGIPPKIRERIFDPVFYHQRCRKRDGNGIGGGSRNCEKITTALFPFTANPDAAPVSGFCCRPLKYRNPRIPKSPLLCRRDQGKFFLSTMNTPWRIWANRCWNGSDMR